MPVTSRRPRLWRAWLLLFLAFLPVIGVGLARSTTVIADETLSPVVPPGSAPAWLIPAPLFANSVVHWTTFSLSHQPARADPMDGQILVGEGWVAYDDTGNVVRLRRWFTRQDGSFVQEIRYADGVQQIVFSPDYGISEPPTANCVLTRPFPEGLKPGTDSPPFAASEETLASIGFAPVQSNEPTFPETSALPGAVPTQTFVAGDPLHAWERRTSADGVTTIQRLEVSVAGVMVQGDLQFVDDSGAVTDETHLTQGTTYVYAQADVPNTVFDLVATVEGECHV
jgi:hypothetical protein